MTGPLLVIVGAILVIFGLYSFVKRLADQRRPPEPDDEADKW